MKKISISERRNKVMRNKCTKYALFALYVLSFCIAFSACRVNSANLTTTETLPFNIVNGGGFSGVQMETVDTIFPYQPENQETTAESKETTTCITTASNNDETPEINEISEIIEETAASVTVFTNEITETQAETISEAVYFTPETSALLSEQETAAAEISVTTTTAATTAVITTAVTTTATTTAVTTTAAATTISTTTSTESSATTTTAVPESISETYITSQTTYPASVSAAETLEPSEQQHSFMVNTYNALNYENVKGVWISYIDLYPMLTGKTEEQFRENISAAYDKCKELGLNTVYVHVRSHGDAFYPSDLYTWSKYTSGSVGVSPGFDPLEIMIEEAHERKLSFHAWINPLRCMAAGEMESISEEYKLGEWYKQSSGTFLREVSGYYYMNPAYVEVIELAADGAAEIVSKYNVDGIHIDDYFYPTTDESFDSGVFEGSGYSSLSDFRLANSSKLVKAMYDSVKSVNPTALFGVSPQGSIYNNYTAVYADVKLWCSQYGYADYIAPQLYFGFNNPINKFDECLNEWLGMTAEGIDIIAGIALYKLGETDQWAGNAENEWIDNPNIITEQVSYAMSPGRCSGYIFYSYAYLDKLH